MVKKTCVKLILVGIAVLMATTIGCASNRLDLVKTGKVFIETVPSQKVKILWVNIYQEGDELVVYGVVRRFGISSYPLKTYVDISILSADGTLLHEARTPDIWVPRRLSGKGIAFKRFRMRFPDIPPEGSLIRTVCHGSPHNDKGCCS